jgi:3-oxoacyl-[acyl-carrier protein] reductase
MRLRDKRVIVTGGGSGLGKAITTRFAEEGAQVLISARRSSPLASVAAVSDRIHPFPADLTAPDGPAMIVEEAVRVLGGIDILVNNSGVFYATPIEETSEQTYDHLFEVNVKGLYRMTQAALPELRKGCEPNIVNIGSIVGMVGIPAVSAYSATKGAVAQITRSLAAELAPQKIRVNCVCPGLVVTELTADLVNSPEFLQKNLPAYPLGRFGEPDDIAWACVFLASSQASWCTGVILPVDGGFTSL